MIRDTSAAAAVTRIVHVSDLHLEPDGSEQYPGLFARVQRIASRVRELQPDLVVATGDLTNLGSSTPEHFGLAREWLDGLGVPWLAVPGNHDLGANAVRSREFPLTEQYEAVPFDRTGYARHFGAELVPRTTVNGLTVIGVVLREGDPDGALEHLERAFGEASGPIVVAGHYPVIDTRTLHSDEPFGSYGYIDELAPRMRALLAAHPRVIAYLAGHVHLTAMQPLGGACMQFTAGGLGPGAAALRYYDWDGAEWSYSTLDVEGAATFWESGLDEARADPLFSSGTPHERAGIHRPSAISMNLKDLP